MSKRPRKRAARETRATYRAARRPSLQRLVRALRAADPDIIAIVQFGSSVYAPRLARDVDLLVLTRAKKDYSVYLDAVADYPKNVDIVPKEPGESIEPDIVLSIFTFGKTLFGNGIKHQEARPSMPVPTFEQARKRIHMAEQDFARAKQETDADYRGARFKLAFDWLFNAARYAAMTFLVLDEQTRWSELPKKLPAPFNKQFRELISFLHVQFKYQGTYPKDRVDETFAEWRDKVSAFIAALETQAQKDHQCVNGNTSS